MDRRAARKTAHAHGSFEGHNQQMKALIGHEFSHHTFERYTTSKKHTEEFMKWIADACKITKKMTFHMARHTFATTVTLSNGVPIATVGRMLGHKNLKTTQHYAGYWI